MFKRIGVLVLLLIAVAGCGGGQISTGGSPTQFSAPGSTSGLGLAIDFGALNSRELRAQSTTGINRVVADVLSVADALPLIPQTMVERPATGQSQVVEIRLEVPVGTVQVRVRGLDDSDRVVATFSTTTEVLAGRVATVEANLFGDPLAGLAPLLPGQLRFVLTWGAEPRDLDSHLWLPSSIPYHLFFSRQGSLTACPFASLDIDDTSGFGPEVVTITNFQPGTYEYAVVRFSGTGTLAGSGAQVQVFNSAGLVTSFTAPTTGTGDIWRVCSIDGNFTAVTSVNTILPMFEPYPDTGAGCP